MNILMVASEALPFAKTGGLADVVFALSKELVRQKQTVSVVLPLYPSIQQRHAPSLIPCGQFDVFLSWRKQTAMVYRLEEQGIQYYFIGNDYYFSRTQFYGFIDDGERFAFFTLAVKAMLKFLPLKVDCIHLHDWQAGMLPVLIREQHAQDPFFKQTRFLITIHNPAFQGYLDATFLGDFYNLPYHLFESGKVRFGAGISTLKSALVYCDRTTTVSPTHAKELLTDEGGYGLNYVLQSLGERFSGILNGLDIAEWNPETDPHLAKTYSAKTVATLKKENKQALLKRLELPDVHAPTFAVVSRLTWQKGINLIVANAQRLIDQGANLVILGSGETQLEHELRQLKERHPLRISFQQGYNEPLAHLMYAGSDFFLMPSLFEPCGISQMIALRYGTVPVVRNTGGLADTIIPIPFPLNEKNPKGNGVMFNDFNEDGFAYAIKVALELYQRPSLMSAAMLAGMKENHSWESSALAYLRLYEAMS